MTNLEELKAQSAALLVAIRAAEARRNMRLARALLAEKYEIDKCVYAIERAAHLRKAHAA